jgi:hypothetical protein
MLYPCPPFSPGFHSNLGGGGGGGCLLLSKPNKIRALLKFIPLITYLPHIFIVRE